MTAPFDLHEIPPARTEGISATLDGADRALLVAVFDSVPGRAVFVGLDLVYRLANQEFLDFVGKPAAEVIGKSVADVLGQDVSDAYLPLVDRIANGEQIRWEGWADYARFGRRYVQESVTPYRRDPAGPVIGALAIARDLTDLKEREIELGEQQRARSDREALHQAIVRTSLDCIIVVDGDGRVVDFNPASERLFGYSRAEALGQEISSLIIPEKYRRAHHDGMQRYISSGISTVIGKRVELEAQTRDGRVIPVELSIADVGFGESRYFTAHIRDLSAAKAAQYEIERQREAIYQKEKLAALGSLLSGVAHELNNPLSIVIGQAMMLKDKIGAAGAALGNGSDLVGRAEKIETAANRCARIVKTFLAMARQRKTERTGVAIAKVVADAADLLSYSLKTSEIGRAHV
jgi:two-component system NtrC family sensor kinase